MNKANLRIKVLTLFPEAFPGTLGLSLAGTGLKNGLWNLEVINIRDFGFSKHKTVDDEPFGGGSGMLMRPDVIGSALDSAKKDMKNPLIIYTSPKGQKFAQDTAKTLSKLSEIIIICGRFEGIDERVIEEYNVREISIGDFVLSGGEIAAISIIDAVVRLIPGILSNQGTFNEESFNYYENIGHLLEYPQYTRPAIWNNREVPEVLKSGNHQQIRDWRKARSLELTKKRRPDLLIDN